MFTLLMVTGLIALASGVFVIAKSQLFRGLAHSDAAAVSDLFAKQDRGVATRFGVAISFLGAVLVLLDLAGFALSATTAGILLLLVVGFLFAHNSYWQDLRAARRHNAAT